MNFEELPNELIISMFEYLYPIDLFQTFYGLNIRINQLISNNFKICEINLQSIRKQVFFIICSSFPSIHDKITSLILSGNDETPNLPELFLQNGFTLTGFTRLKSLTLDSINSFEILQLFLSQCHFLSNLQIFNCKKLHEEEQILSILEFIWHLSNLKSVRLKDSLHFGKMFKYITNISSSIETLLFDNVIQLDFDGFINLIHHSVKLQQICMTMESSHSYLRITERFSSIISLKLLHKGIRYGLINFLKAFPNLIDLSVETEGTFIDGYQWEDLIHHSLLNLERFQFQMNVLLLRIDDADVEQRIDELLNTFRSLFWLEERQWFVRCRWTQSSDQIQTTFYSLPYSFEKFVAYEKSKSTCLNQDEFCSYDQVNMLTYNDSINGLFSLANNSQVCFSKIQQLAIEYPFKEHIWSFIPTLNMLKSLHVRFQDKIHSVLFQSLLDKSPNL
ncbi:unnamed protein product, partial [Adineta ricciae]